MIGIYKIENKINGKCYIGQSENIGRRWRAHQSAAFNPNANNYDTTLYRAIRKYGLENFTFTILVECEISQLDELEKSYIRQFNSLTPNGYNLTAGGAESVCSFKLTQNEVDTIIELLQNSDKSQDEIAAQFNVSQKMISNINTGNSWIRCGITYPIRSKSRKSVCKLCGIEIATNSDYCVDCAKKNMRKTERPSREELKQLIREKTFVSIGESFNVSDNAIRKWCAAYNLPTKKTEIKSFSDEEWKQI